jgi:hypothetical protein
MNETPKHSEQCPLQGYCQIGSRIQSWEKDAAVAFGQIAQVHSWVSGLTVYSKNLDQLPVIAEKITSLVELMSHLMEKTIDKSSEERRGVSPLILLGVVAMLVAVIITQHIEHSGGDASISTPAAKISVGANGPR